MIANDIQKLLDELFYNSLKCLDKKHTLGKEVEE